jgi:peptidoglycan-associated lipoprotein
MFAKRGTLGCLALVVLLAGCASGVKLEDQVPIESRTPTGVDALGGGAGSGTGQSSVTTVDLAKNALSGVARVIYFDFDSFIVKDEYRSVIESYAKALSLDRQRKLAIEGHTDERGGREYNLALGQKRAEAVLKSLTLLGANEAQLEAVSFGKERPAVTGNDEVAWAKNRRAELKDR